MLATLLSRVDAVAGIASDATNKPPDTVAAASIAPRDQGGHPAFAMERQRPLLGYTRIERPVGVEARPDRLDRRAFNHNFRANRAFRIGHYAAPPNWHYRRWHYGEILPAYFWSDQYRIADFWLFGLDVAPMRS